MGGKAAIQDAAAVGPGHQGRGLGEAEAPASADADLGLEASLGYLIPQDRQGLLGPHAVGAGCTADNDAEGGILLLPGRLSPLPELGVALEPRRRCRRRRPDGLGQAAQALLCAHLSSIWPGPAGLPLFRPLPSLRSLA